MSSGRVVITGLGAVTPIGSGVDAFFEALLAGTNGIGPVTRFDATGFRAQLAAEVSDFDPLQWIERRDARRMDRFTHFGITASSMAMEDAGLAAGGFEPTRAGIILGSGIGGSRTIEDGYDVLNSKGARGLDPFFISRLLINMAAAMTSIRFGLKGHMSALSVACSTGANAVGDALRVIQRGEADVMLAGGAEAAVDRLAYGGFCATRSMSSSTDPESGCRPFDLDRDGFVMGEGGGMAVLEDLDHALARGARIYAEVVGYGNTADAHHLTAPAPGGEGMARVMKRAIEDAGIPHTQVGYVNAHGTSTRLNDACESAAIQTVFGEHAAKLKVSSNKSMIGHTLAGAGAIELVATVKSIQSGMVPPTIHYESPDPECPLDYVPNRAEQVDLEAAITNSFGFGGGNACLVVKRYDGGSHEDA
jgi:3-oxoacyl-[acyl-carrier-protein] synthase II